MKKRDKAKRKAARRNSHWELFSLRLPDGETIKIIPTVNRYNHLLYVDIAKFRCGQRENGIRINEKNLRQFLKMLGDFSTHIELEQIDPNWSDRKKLRVR